LTPGEIRERLTELRRAGAGLRRRSARGTLDALARVLDGWSDPGSAWRRALEAELPGATGFSPETVSEGLRRGLAHWNGQALHALAARELGALERLDDSLRPMIAGFDATAVLLAGSIPMPTLLALLAPLVLRSPVLAKSASRDAVTPHLVARSIAEVDAELGRCIEVVDFPGEDDERMAALLEAGCIVASGSDETVAAIRARAAPPQRLVAYGHRLSVAALGEAAARGDQLEDTVRRLALDVALWDQLGCLSPIVVYVEGEAAADAASEALAGALAEVEQRMPRGKIEPRAAALIAHERARAELRAAAGERVRLHASDGTAWTVVREARCGVLPAPLHRFVRIMPVADSAHLLDALAPLAPHLAATAVEGFGAGTPQLARDLAQLGASRVCAPGALQTPPLDWHHDGKGVLSPLARFTDLELPQ
jgi:hypothetical protein